MVESVQVEIKDRLEKLISFFENLSPENLSELSGLYAQEAHFKDPFNDIEGISKIEAIFLHMFKTLKAPQFFIKEVASQGQHTFLTWDFQFEMDQMPSKGQLTIKGATHLIWSFDDQRKEWRISRHRDYWDAAEELYEKLPFLGAIMRWVKSRMTASL